MDARTGARLVDDVNGLIGQEAVLNVAARKRHRGSQRILGVLDVVMLLVALLQAMQNLERVGNGRLADVDRLEAALQRRVLLDVLAILVGGSRADHLNLATGQGRLQDGRGVDGTLRSTRTNDGVELVDEQDDVVRGLDLGNDLLHALLELATILRASNERRDIERPNLLSAQHVGHLARGDELREALDDGRLANTGVAQNERIVLLTARENLHDSLDLTVAPNHGIKLAIDGEARQVAAILLKHRAVICRGLRASHTAHKLRAAEAHVTHRLLALSAVRSVLDELVDGIAHCVARDAHARKRGHRTAVALGDDTQKQMLGGDIGLSVGHGLAVGVLEHALGTRREGDVTARGVLRLLRRDAAHGGEGLLIGDIELCERLRRNALALLDEGKKQVLGAHIHLAEAASLVLRKAHHLARFVRELLKHMTP